MTKKKKMRWLSESLSNLTILMYGIGGTDEQAYEVLDCLKPVIVDSNVRNTGVVFDYNSSDTYIDIAAKLYGYIPVHNSEKPIRGIKETILKIADVFPARRSEVMHALSTAEKHFGGDRMFSYGP